MSTPRLTVVLSQAQGKNPARRTLEESIAASLIMEPGLDVSIVPYLYDLGPDHTGRLFLESIRGDMVILAWMYPRAAFWLLDRNGIQGHEGISQLSPPAPADEEDEAPAPARGIGVQDVPDRTIYCIDLREKNDHRPYIAEVLRIAQECRDRQATLPKSTTAIVQLGLPNGNGTTADVAAFAPEKLLAQPARRWYPVIDYSRCTNCMECLDFCLFGVYGVDGGERILVENQDSCKKGCPACSRVCPEQAIMFPDYKTPAIAGAPVGAVSGLKIDLSRLFGGGDPLAMAAQERDVELVRDGRDAVGLTVGIPKRQQGKSEQPKDDLDRLMDDLDALEI